MYKVGEHKPTTIEESQMQWEILKALLPTLSVGNDGVPEKDVSYYLSLAQEFVLEFVEYNWGVNPSEATLTGLNAES